MTAATFQNLQESTAALKRLNASMLSPTSVQELLDSAAEERAKVQEVTDLINAQGPVAQVDVDAELQAILRQEAEAAGPLVMPPAALAAAPAPPAAATQPRQSARVAARVLETA